MATGLESTESDTERGTDSEPEDSELPALAGIRPRAHTPAGDPAVEIRFENGAQIRYRVAEDGLYEEWFSPDDDRPARSHAVTAPVGHDAEGEGEARFEGRPSTRVLTDRALCTVSTYLSFDDRQQALFVWGDANIGVLCGRGSA